MMLQEWLYKPWPWYIVGPLMGATIPLLLCTNDSRKGDFYWNSDWGILVCKSKRLPTTLKEAYHKNGPSVAQVVD